MKEYSLKLVCICIIIVKIEGNVNNISSFKYHIEETSLENRRFLLPTKEDDYIVATRMSQNTFMVPYFPKYNLKIQNVNTRSLNFAININVFDKHWEDKLLKKYWRKRYQNLKKNKRKFTKLKKFYDNRETEKSYSKKYGNTFDKMELIVVSQRTNKYVESSTVISENLFKANIKNNNSNRSVFLSTKFLPKIVNKRQATDVSRWLMNLKEIMAMNPVLKTEKSTQPEVRYIDEWRYSYRVTFYKTGRYNVSNYICSGILMAPQWILTSLYCSLGEDLLIIIGVYSLPKIILDHNKYMANKKIYSLKEDLVLIEMDRPVEWKFVAPDVRALKRNEIDSLLDNGKCSVLSWIPVDIEKKRFELRKYPLPKSRRMHSSKEMNLKNRIEVETLQTNILCGNDLGSPVLCEGIVTGIISNVHKDCRSNLTVKLLCPVLEWITFFTKEKSYLEISARKWPPTNFSERPVVRVHIIILLFTCVFYVY